MNSQIPLCLHFHLLLPWVIPFFSHTNPHFAASISATMATDVINKEIQNHFKKLEAQTTIISTYTDLFKTLTSHFTTFDQSVTSKCQNLDSKIQSLDSEYQKSIEDLQQRENSLAERISSLSALVESRKDIGLAECEKPPPAEDAPLGDVLKSVCRKMDHSRLLKLAVSRRRESAIMRAEMGNALAEAVDPPRLVLDAVNEFVEIKAMTKSGLTDKRWACAMVVGGLFPPDELKERKVGSMPMFSKATVDRAEDVVRHWKETAENIAAAGGIIGGSNVENLTGMGPAEASILIQLIVGFGLKERFEDEFYTKLVVEFSSRKDLPKLAVALYGDQISDLIDELIKNGKQGEAVYFATEAKLTKKFPRASLLDSYLEKTRSTVTDILKKGNHSYASKEEATLFEISAVKLVLKTVGDLKIESEYPLENLKRRLTSLEKTKNDMKRGLAAGSRPPPTKRPYGGSGSARSSGPPLHRPTKMARFPSPSPGLGPYPSFGQRNPILPAQQAAASRYPTPYSNYPGYGGSHIPPSPQITQPPYGIPGDSVGAGARLGGSYGGQTGYGSYEYTPAAAPTYRPPYGQ